MTSLNAAIISHRKWLVGLAAAVAVGATTLRLQSKNIAGREVAALSGRTTTIFVAPFSLNENSGEHVSGAQLAEQVGTALSADKSLKISRSEMQSSNAQLAAARRAGAHFVLMGTVERKQRGAEIALRLVRASDASTAWSGTFWKSAADLPLSAGDLAAAVSEAIRAQRDSDARRREQQSSRTQGRR
jgi:TolB-like protein